MYCFDRNCKLFFTEVYTPPVFSDIHANTIYHHIFYLCQFYIIYHIIILCIIYV